MIVPIILIIAFWIFFILSYVNKIHFYKSINYSYKKNFPESVFKFFLPIKNIEAEKCKQEDLIYVVASNRFFKTAYYLFILTWVAVFIFFPYKTFL